MSSVEKKDWLVRTRQGVILGPYSEIELWDAFQSGLFREQDEIALSNNAWISAQHLKNYVEEESTSTKTELSGLSANSLSIKLPPVVEEVVPTPAPAPVASAPSPSIGPGVKNPQPQGVSKLPPRRNSPISLYKTANGWRKLKPLLPYFALSLIFVGLYLFLKNTEYEDKAQKKVSSFEDLKEVATFLAQINNFSESYHSIETFRPNNQVQGLDPNVSLLEASILIYDNQFGKAKRLLEPLLVLNQNPVKAEAHFWLGFSQLAKKEEDSGESHFLQSLELNPKNVAARYNLGRAYFKNGKFRQSLDYFQLAELEESKSWIIALSKARARQELGEFDQAEAGYLHALQLAPDVWETYASYALFLLKKKEVSKAQGVLKKMIAKDPDFEDLIYLPFGYYHEKADKRVYLSLFQRAFDKENSVEKQLAEAYIESFIPLTPAPLLTTSLTPDPFSQFVFMRFNLIKDGSQFELSNSIKNIDSFLELLGYYAYALKAKIEIRLKNDYQAIQTLDKALSAGHQAAILYYLKMQIFDSQNALRQKKETKKQLLSLYPNYIPAHK